MRDEVYELEQSTVVVIPPETLHYTLPQEDLVLCVANTPPFNPANIVGLNESNSVVGFIKEKYEKDVAIL